jgi:hypothetical protein
MGLLLLSAGSVAAAQKDEAPRSRLQPLFDTPLRDTSICKGGDGAWYLTGTPADFQNNDGICLWRSTDCKTWTEIGPVWSIERQSSAWQKQYRVNPDNPTGAEKEKGVRSILPERPEGCCAQNAPDSAFSALWVTGWTSAYHSAARNAPRSGGRHCPAARW